MPAEPFKAGGKRRSWVYAMARFIATPFSYDVVGLENVQTAGPSIFIANHLGSLGPIQIILSVPIRFYPWVVADMTDFKRAPQYLYKDFVHSDLHLSGKVGMAFSTMLTKISVNLLKSIDSISIEQSGRLSPVGFRQSICFLKEGRNLLIFPEDSDLPLNPITLMSPFLPGFAVLCKLFQQESNSLLPVYPIAVHARAKRVMIGSGEFYHHDDRPRGKINDFCLLLEKRVTDIYLEMDKITDDILDG